MKWVWGAVATVAVLGVLCCGGLFFFGSRVLRTAQKDQAEATRYAEESIDAICKSWSPDELKKRADPTGFTATELAGTEASFARLSKKLGPIKSLGPFHATGFRSYAGADGSYLRIDLKGHASFEKGEADIDIPVARRNDVWHLFALHVTPNP